MDNQFYVSRDGNAGQYRVFSKDATASVLEHERLTGDEAAFLAAHMNHAFTQGANAGDKRRRDAICEALGLV